MPIQPYTIISLHKMYSDLKDGDVVWKKWDNYFWPCVFHPIDKIPGGNELPKRFVGAVEFFGEDKYSYLTARTMVYPYNCVEKHSFIKKGVQKHQKSGEICKYMIKFLQDVRLAEARTNGNIKILSLPEFQSDPNSKSIGKEVGRPTSNSNGESTSHFDNNRCKTKDEGSVGLVVKGCDDKKHRMSTSQVAADLDQPGSAQIYESRSKRIKLADDVKNYDDDSSDEDTSVNVLNRSSANRDKDFVVDQIVLVPWRKAYFPAFITKVIKTKKKNVVYFRYVNSPRQSMPFRKNSRCVLDFRDSERNSKLRDAAASIEPSAIEAYDRCVQYLSIRTNRIKDLSAFRFLTRHPNDLHYGVLPDSELHVSVKDLCLDSEISKERMSKMYDTQTSEDDTESEDEIVPPPPCISYSQFTKEQLATTMQEASKLLEVIKSDACLSHLKSILTGSEDSWRHKIFHHGTLEERDELRGSSGMGVFYDQEQSFELLCLLRENLPRVASVDKSRYMLNVWLPEAILYALKKVHSFDHSEAERHLQITSCLSDYLEYLKR